MSHHSRLCHIVIDCDDLDEAVHFWSAALRATEDVLRTADGSTVRGKGTVYRRLILPDTDIRILLQHTTDTKTTKSRIHLDIETDNVEAEVNRLETLGATRSSHQTERGWDYWIMHDPSQNEFCILQTWLASRSS